MAMGRSAALDAKGRWGESVWLLLCRSALRGIRWSARALASDAVEVSLERSELLARLGGTADTAGAALAIDWEKLDPLDRAQLARWLGQRRPD